MQLCKHLQNEVSIGRNTVPSNKELMDGTLSKRFRPLTPYWTESFSNVRRCWLAMPLGAGILSWLLACRTIEEEKGKLDFGIDQCRLQVSRQISSTLFYCYTPVRDLKIPPKFGLNFE